MSPHHHEDKTDPAPNTGTATDPVCGMKVEIKEGARRRDYAGETFHFCSDGCQKKFDADPYFYASGNAEKAGQRAQPGSQYTCPMHPEIVRVMAPGVQSARPYSWKRRKDRFAGRSSWRTARRRRAARKGHVLGFTPSA